VAPWPPTVIVVHPKENRRKCSMEPLRPRSDLKFLSYEPSIAVELPGYVRLSVDGPPLTAADAAAGILLIDGVWRYADAMQRQFAAVPPRSLSGFRTAYPRVSKLFRDPPGGLASVEALYIAYRILQRPSDGLLDGYRWAGEFLALNGWG
jgi:pre-rRNA-processing protein TSR3